LAEAVRVLVGWRFVSVTRTRDIAEFTFERDGQWHLLVARCASRVVRNEVILLGSYDMRPTFDANAEWLTGILEQRDVRVCAATLLSGGHLVIELFDRIRIDVLPVRAGPVEAWRLIRGGGEYHVYPPTGPNRPCYGADTGE
jgi:hypothetical protein